MSLGLVWLVYLNLWPHVNRNMLLSCLYWSSLKGMGHVPQSLFLKLSNAWNRWNHLILPFFCCSCSLWWWTGLAVLPAAAFLRIHAPFTRAACWQTLRSQKKKTQIPFVWLRINLWLKQKTSHCLHPQSTIIHALYRPTNSCECACAFYPHSFLMKILSKKRHFSIH